MFTLLIPTHNESKRILPTLKQVTTALRNMRYRILVVDDSSDPTPAVVQHFAKKSTVPIQVIHFSKRQGKGGAIAKGLKRCKEDVVLYDADAATPAREIPKLVTALKRADLVLGSRYIAGSSCQGVTPFRWFVSRCFNALTRILFGLSFSDTQCGFKAIRARVLPNLIQKPFHSTSWEWDVELLYRAKEQGLRMVEVPTTWKHVTGSRVETTGTIKTGLQMLKGLLKLRLRLLREA